MRCRKLPLSTWFTLLMMMGCVYAKESTAPTDIGYPNRAAVTELKTFSMGFSVAPPFLMRGKEFQWDHEIQVALPATYQTEHKAYPVVWIMDGDTDFALAVRTLALWELTGRLPQMIIVGVGATPVSSKEFAARRTYEFSPSPTDSWEWEGLGGDLAKRLLARAGSTPRTLKYGTGGAPKFLSFLVDEIRPALEKKYRLSGSHTLFGSSGGGQFCAFALLTRPKSFDKYICLSAPFYTNHYEFFHLEEKYAAANKDLPAEVYFAAGEGEILQGGSTSAYGIVSSMSRMAEILTLREYPSLKLYVHIFPDETHSTFESAGLAQGLLTLWGSR